MTSIAKSNASMAAASSTSSGSQCSWPEQYHPTSLTRGEQRPRGVLDIEWSADARPLDEFRGQAVVLAGTIVLVGMRPGDHIGRITQVGCTYRAGRRRCAHHAGRPQAGRIDGGDNALGAG